MVKENNYKSLLFIRETNIYVKCNHFSDCILRILLVFLCLDNFEITSSSGIKPHKIKCITLSQDILLFVYFCSKEKITFHCPFLDF